MSGCEQDLQHSDSTSAGKQLVVQTYEESSLQALEALVKSAIRIERTGIRFPGRLVDIQFAYKAERYRVYCTFESPRDQHLHDVLDGNLIAEMSVKHEDYQIATKEPLSKCKGSIMKVEVLEASISAFEIPMVIKLYHCGFINLNVPVLEALAQIRATSTYACKLIDIFIRAGTKNLLEVGLVMEKLINDLGADIENKARLRTPYTEEKLRQILENVADALFFMKSLVRII